MRATFGSAAVAIALAGVVAGCGSVGNSGGSGGGSGGSGSSDSSKTVKIGMSSVLSGPVASAGTGTDAGLEAYLKNVNASGGVNGYKFTFDALDNQYDPAQAATVARQLVSADAFLIVSEGTEPLKAMVPITAPHQIPNFTESLGEIVTPPKGQYSDVYGMNPSYHDICYSAADFIMNTLHEKTASVAYLDNDGETTAGTAFPAAFKAEGGKVPDVEAIQTTTTDYAPMAQRLKAAGAPVVYAYVLDSQLPGLQKAAAAIGYHPKWVTWFQTYSPSYLQLAGSKLSTGVYTEQYSTPLSDTSSPQVKQFKTVMKKYSPSFITSDAAEQGWTFGAAIVRGIKDATAGGKPLTHASFEHALDNLNGVPLGLVPSMTYDSKTHAGATDSAYYQIQSDGSLKASTKYAKLPTSMGG